MIFSHINFTILRRLKVLPKLMGLIHKHIDIITVTSSRRTRACTDTQTHFKANPPGTHIYTHTLQSKHLVALVSKYCKCK